MKIVHTCFLILLILCSIAFAGTSVTGGGVLIFNGYDTKGGLNLEYLQLFDLSQKIAIGGKLGFNRWNTIKTRTIISGAGATTTEEKKGNYILEFAPAFRFYAKTSDYTKFFLEPSAGIDLFIYTGLKVNQDLFIGPLYEETKRTDGAFGFSIAAGFDFKKIEVKPSYKMYIKNKEALKLLSFAMGVNF